MCAQGGRLQVVHIQASRVTGSFPSTAFQLVTSNGIYVHALQESLFPLLSVLIITWVFKPAKGGLSSQCQSWGSMLTLMSLMPHHPQGGFLSLCYPSPLCATLKTTRHDQNTSPSFTYQTPYTFIYNLGSGKYKGWSHVCFIGSLGAQMGISLTWSLSKK